MLMIEEYNEGNVIEGIDDAEEFWLENTEGNMNEGMDDSEEFCDLVTVWFFVNKQSQS